MKSSLFSIYICTLTDSSCFSRTSFGVLYIYRLYPSTISSRIPATATKQLVDHVHFHVIPKPNEEEGLVVGWPAKAPAKEELQKVYDEMKGKLGL